MGYSRVIGVFGPTGTGFLLGGMIGSALAAPNVHADVSGKKNSKWYRALSGFAANLAIPGALLIMGGKNPNPSLARSMAFGAAAAVAGSWWGVSALSELKPPHTHTHPHPAP